MTQEPVGTATELLLAWSRGDNAAGDALMPLVYQDLHRRAAAYLRHERDGHTLQPTALVHEAYVRLVRQTRVTWQNRAQFFGVAAKMMRRVLVDHARERLACKRPGGLRVTLDERLLVSAPENCEVLMLHQALDELAALDPRQAHIVELKYFGGLSEQEIAELVSLSRATVQREWQSARAWMFRRLTKTPDSRHER